MHIQPTRLDVVHFEAPTQPHETTLPFLLSSCDSAAAVLDEDQIAQWFALFDKEARDPDAEEYCDFYTLTMLCDIQGQKLVVAADSDGDCSVGPFQEFCEAHNVPYITARSTLDFSGATIDELRQRLHPADPAQERLVALLHALSN